jgi:hypothetical protein
MNILVIGNGFDLEHRLPTKCIDFLNYCREHLDKDDLDKPYYSEMSELLENNLWMKYFRELTSSAISNKKWINENTTWIDFESEIVLLIREFYKCIYKSENVNSYFSIGSLKEQTPIKNLKSSKFNINNLLINRNLVKYPLLSLLIKSNSNNFKIITLNNDFIFTINDLSTVNQIIDFLWRQLNYFARAFEIYCV